MERIASFTINHDTLTPGMYVSRVDGDVTTYDLRMVYPNRGIYIDVAAMHTFEHLFATYVRNSPAAERVIYCGPMGCRTGFYFLMRHADAAADIALVKDTLQFVEDYKGAVPGATRAECGNYLEHDLPGARQVARELALALTDWTPEKLTYPA